MSAQMKSGYKLTEAGVIPEDWDCHALKNLLVQPIQNGIFNDPKYKGYGYKLINVGDLYKDSPINTGSLEYLHAKKADVDRFKVADGDVFFTRSSITPDGIAHCNIYNSDEQVPVLFDCHIVRARVNAKKINPFFFFRYCITKPARTYLTSNAKTTTMTTIDQGVIDGLPVIVPPLAEQLAIATVLSDMDAMISGLDLLIAKKRDIKQAAMQQLLSGQKRLPGFSGEWKVKTLIEIADRKKELFDDGDWIESEHITNQGVRLIQTGNIGVGKFIEKDVRKYIFERSFIALRCKELRHGDLLVCRLADPAGRACVLPDIGEEKIVTSVDVTIFRAPVDTVDRVFLSNLFSTPEWFQAVSDRSGGTTHKRISRGALGRISIKIPAIQEQTAIATILSDMDNELESLESRRDKALQIKQGMMQELLTGKTRIS